MKLNTYSFGVGDRFGLAGIAQLKAILNAQKKGIDVTPVWNKSHREHEIVGTSPVQTRCEADEVARSCNWKKPYFVDADHITLETVDEYLDYCDFFTIDVAEFIDEPAKESEIENFINENRSFLGELSFPGLQRPFVIDHSILKSVAETYLQAALQARKVYGRIVEKKDRKNIVIEISMDEVETPQSPIEIFFILKMLADLGVRPDTIAPKFSGRFNKGIDYNGNLSQFISEFEQAVLVIRYAKERFNLPENLKLSIHSGSDKFSLYKPVNKILNTYNAGLHLKTAGTTWLEELAGLALAGSEGLNLAKTIYTRATERFEELTIPYKTVLDITKTNLPAVKDVETWDGIHFAKTLQHDPKEPAYNSDFRQLIHCSYKIAAEMGDEFLNAIKKHQDTIAPKVEENLYQKHILPLFAGL